MGSLLQDLRFALRQMRKNSGFTLTAVLTLALGIGANVAIFLVLHGTLRLPFPQADKLVAVRNTYPGAEDTPGSLPDFQDWRREAKSFSRLVAVFPTRMTYLGKREPMRIPVAYISDGFLATFGLSPVLGRGFLATDQQKGADAVYVLSEDFWNSQFGGSPSVLGSSITLNGRAGTVVGVVPRMVPSFNYEPQVWIPLEAAPPYQERGTNFLYITGLLNNGVTVASARSELEVLQRQIDKQFPANAHGIGLQPLARSMFGDIRLVTLILMAAVGFILLIACVNLANMLLARATDRMREFAIRNALGASLRRLFRQTITESLVLASLGGLFGLVCAVAVTRIPVPAWPKFLLAPDRAGIDVTVVLFIAGLVVLTGVIFGIIPALYVVRQNFAAATSPGRTLTGTREQNLTRSILMVSEIILATFLVAGALTTARYFLQLLHTDPGINPDHVLSMTVSLSPTRYPKEEEQRKFFDQLLERLKASPATVSAGGSSAAPFAGNPQTGDFDYEGKPVGGSSSQPPFAADYFVTPGYFETLQIPILQGRSIDRHDAEKSPKVIVINRTMAAALWPGESAIGKRIKVMGKWNQVVGVAGDVRSSGVSQPVSFQLYLSALQYPVDNMTLLMRITTEPLSAADAAKREVYAIDPEQAVSNVVSVEQLASTSISGQRTSTALIGSLGGLAMLLASVGVYGVMAYSVSRREREFGIRMAMGALPRDILALLLRRSSYLVLVGVIAGVMFAIPFTRWVNTLLPGSHFSVPTIVAAGVLLAIVAMFATYLPTRRAASVEPMVALRTE